MHSQGGHGPPQSMRSSPWFKMPSSHVAAGAHSSGIPSVLVSSEVPSFISHQSSTPLGWQSSHQELLSQSAKSHSSGIWLPLQSSLNSQSGPVMNIWKLPVAPLLPEILIQYVPLGLDAD